MTQKETSRGRSSKQMSHSTMLIFVALLSAFPMMATDLYLPAVPTIKDQLNTTVELVNLTLVVFFVSMSFSTLISGPLSDRLGRKPVLLFSIILYLIASIACVFSPDIYYLIAARVFQALGCGAAMAQGAAIVKDYFPPEVKDKAFAIIGAMTGITPIVAPVIGAQLLRFTSWRGEFAILALIGLISLIFSFRFKETHFDLSTESVPLSILRLFVVLRNPAFARLLALFSFATLGMMAYVGISSIIYVQRFGLTEQEYSYFFAANAVVSVISALAYIKISRIVSPMILITVSFILATISGVMIIFFGSMGPFLFLIAIAVSSVSFSLSRPPSMNLMLEQQEKDTGSASSLMSFFQSILGSVALAFISHGWENRILVLGLIYTIIGAFSLAFWLYAKHHCKVPRAFLVGT